MQFHQGMHTIAQDYDGFIIDLWGVTHDGVRPYPGVLDCLQALKESGKRIVFLSNAPRRTYVARARLTHLGIGSHLYDDVMTSGEDVYKALTERKSPWYQAVGKSFYHLGPAKDHSIFEGLERYRVDSLHDAQFLLCSGLPHEGDQMDRYEDLLHAAIALKLPMVCANPDIIVHWGGKMVACAGAMAARYKYLGGRVHYHGKPYQDIYETVMGMFAPGDTLLAIGDSFETDVPGAISAGIPIAFVSGGIHCQQLDAPYGTLPDLQKMQELVEQYGMRPTYVIPGLIW